MAGRWYGPDMRLPGRLRVTTLGDLLGSLYRERATGTLELVEQSGVHAGRVHRVHLDGGLVGEIESRIRSPRLGEILNSEGFIGDRTLRQLVRRLADVPGRRIGELLVENGIATAGLVDAALRFQLRRRLDALFSITDASVRFHVARPRRDDAALPLSPREFLHGRERARDKEPPAAEPPPVRHTAPASRTAPGSARPTGSGSAPRRRQDPVRTRAYDVLGLSPGAGPTDVQRAFRSLAREQHPDRFPGASGSEREALMRRFAELSAAYHLLVG